jgi:hypothetical protein
VEVEAVEVLWVILLLLHQRVFPEQLLILAAVAAEAVLEHQLVVVVLADQ